MLGHGDGRAARAAQRRVDRLHPRHRQRPAETSNAPTASRAATAASGPWPSPSTTRARWRCRADVSIAQASPHSTSRRRHARCRRSETVVRDGASPWARSRFAPPRRFSGRDHMSNTVDRRCTAPSPGARAAGRRVAVLQAAGDVGHARARGRARAISTDPGRAHPLGRSTTSPPPPCLTRLVASSVTTRARSARRRSSSKSRRHGEVGAPPGGAAAT